MNVVIDEAPACQTSYLNIVDKTATHSTRSFVESGVSVGSLGVVTASCQGHFKFHIETMTGWRPEVSVKYLQEYPGTKLQNGQDEAGSLWTHSEAQISTALSVVVIPVG